MEQLRESLEGLLADVETVLAYLDVQPTLEIVEEKPKKQRKRKERENDTNDKGSVKKGKAIVRFIAPDGQKIQVNFDDTSPSMEVVQDEELNKLD